MSSPFGPFERSFFTKDILNKIRLDIILGTIPAETRILETKLSSEFNVSRGPIRAVLQTLEQEGLVKPIPSGGTMVSGFTIKDAEDLFDFRYMLELRALELIMSNPMVSYAPIFNITDKMRLINQKPDHEENLTNTISILDIQFHKSLMIMSENNILLRGWENISNILYTILIIANVSYSSFFEFYKKHKELADGIIQRNPEVNSILQLHILGAKKLMVGRLAANFSK